MKIALPFDGKLLFLTRTVRLFAYGFLSVVLLLYLAEAGLTEFQIGLLLSLTLIGDTAVSLWITTQADRLGRRRMLLLGAGLMAFAGIVFAFTSDFTLLLIAAVIGVISPSGHEIGPFLSIEQAAFSQLIPGPRRTQVFAWYHLVGSLAAAAGAMAGGLLAQSMQMAGWNAFASYQAVVLGYAALGLVLGLSFLRLSPAVEVAGQIAPGSSAPSLFGLHRSRRIVFKLSGLFSLDSFAGGFVIQSILAYWFHLLYGVEPAALGGMFFGANVLSGFSALAAGWLAQRFGLINTMVFTHIPSNVLLILVPLMPSFPLALAALLARACISQMDVPTRQSYTMAVVDPDERSAAAGVTGVARTLGAALAPVFAGPLLASPALMGVPFFLAGGLKIAYDLLLCRSFRRLEPKK